MRHKQSRVPGMLRSPRHRLYIRNPRHPLLSRRARRHWTEKHLGGTKDRGLVRSMQRHSRVMAGQIWPELRRTGSPRYNPKRLWIKGAIRHPGALRRKLSRGYVRGYKLKAGQRIPETLLERAMAVARRKGDTQTMRQINLARRLKGFSRAKAKRGRRYGSTRLAANPRRWTVKWRP